MSKWSGGMLAAVLSLLVVLVSSCADDIRQNTAAQWKDISKRLAEDSRLVLTFREIPNDKRAQRIQGVVSDLESVSKELQGWQESFSQHENTHGMADQFRSCDEAVSAQILVLKNPGATAEQLGQVANHLLDASRMMPPRLAL